MMTNVPDEKLVYLALKSIFNGADARIRNAKPIRRLVQKSQPHNAEVKRLIKEYNFDNVCNVAKTLLEQEIFESTLKAKIRFPELFEISPEQCADRAASEIEAARSEADAIKFATVDRDVDGLSKSSHFANIIDQLPSVIVDSTSRPRKRSSPHPKTRVPSLYPVYLPYRTQHQLLSTIQAMLEQVCYDFAIRTIKDEVEKQGWDCPECVELNVWMRTLVSHQQIIPEEKVEGLGKQFTQLLDSISQLRHTAVHRIRTSAVGLEQYLVDAEGLARILNDDDRARNLMHLRRKMQCTVAELKRNKDLLESKLSAKLQHISDEKARLDQLEIAAIEEMITENKNYEALAGDSLNLAVQSIVETKQNAVSTDLGKVSEPETVNTHVSLDVLSNDDSDIDLETARVEGGLRVMINEGTF